MNNKQKILVGLCTLLFIVLYWGCETKTPQVKDKEKSLSHNIESTGIENIRISAHNAMNEGQRAIIDLLATELSKSTDSTKLEKLINLSSKWYEFGNPAMAGYYAEEVAKIENTEKAWSISGTTYAICIKGESDQKVKDFCTKRALTSFENAITINPANVDHRINTALVKVDNPPNGQPMTGILELLDLNKKYPENVSVLNQLAQLALKTNQVDKAIGRLKKAVELEPNNKMSNCLLVEALTQAGKEEEVTAYKEKCLEK